MYNRAIVHPGTLDLTMQNDVAPVPDGTSCQIWRSNPLALPASDPAAPLQLLRVAAVGLPSGNPPVAQNLHI